MLTRLYDWVMELAARREIEQRTVCDILGVGDIEFLRREDGTVTSDLVLRKDIVRAIRKHKPSAVITAGEALFTISSTAQSAASTSGESRSKGEGG